MEHYLSGRGNFGDAQQEGGEEEEFRSLLDQEDPAVAPQQEVTAEANASVEGENQLLYEEEGGPKVEVVNVDGRPAQIIVHLESGRRLELSCEY
tara:strand:+ start:139 stop:420 length:282 start_codon:yes stop_codon:yes gene_type:complete